MGALAVTNFDGYLRGRSSRSLHATAERVRTRENKTNWMRCVEKVKYFFEERTEVTGDEDLNRKGR